MNRRLDTSPSARKWHRWKIVGSIIAILLLAGAIWLIVSKSGEVAHAWAALTHPNPWWLLLLFAGVLASVPVSAVSQVLMLARTSGVRVRIGEMSTLVVFSTLLNMLPLWPGAIGRIGYHRVVHGIPPMRAGIAIVSVRLLGLSAGVVLLALAWMLGGGGTALIIAAWLSVLVGFLLLSLPTAARLPALAAASCWVDIGVSAIRYVAAFHLLGATLDGGMAAAISGTASIASSVPFVGGAPGLREWSVGWMNAQLQFIPDALVIGVLADLLVRAATFIVMLPLVLITGRGLGRRLRAAAAVMAAKDRSPSPQP